MALSENAPDPVLVDPSSQKIDGALYPKALTPTDGRPHWCDQSVPAEFKAKLDPFDDKKDEVEADALKRKAARGQAISYAELDFAVQQRTFLFMFFFIGRKCRLLCWDRAAVVVSTAFDYYTEWEFMCEVFWKISVLHRFAPERLGEDPSATRIFPGNPDWVLMNDAVKKNTLVSSAERPLAGEELKDSNFVFEYIHKAWDESLDAAWPRYRLQVPHGQTVREFLVCRPYFRAKGLTGRGTRGYVALEKLEKGTGRFVWLKDAWRVDYEDVEPEGTILERLNKAGVRNIPTLVCHGDILGQRTRSHEYWAMKDSPPANPPSHPITPSTASSSRTLVEPEGTTSGGSKRKRVDDTDEPGGPKPNGLGEDSLLDDCPLRRHIHYRVVVEEVCMPLSMFCTGYQLVKLVHDGVVGEHHLSLSCSARSHICRV